jgi:hypothetical protein
MKSKSMFISLIPWVLFTLIAGRLGSNLVGLAAVIAAVAVVGIIIWSRRERAVDGSHPSLKIIDISGVVTFAVIAVLAFTGSDSLRSHLADYGRGGCALVLALVMFASLLVMPFTEQYAREMTPREIWGLPVFRAANRRISAVFGVAVAAMAVSHIYSGYLEAHNELSRRENLVLNWAIPIVLILLALKYVDRVTGDNTPTGTTTPTTPSPAPTA